MIIVDVETTGLDPRTCSIISIGAVDSACRNREFYRECQIDASTEISETALEINGFTREQLFDPTRPTVTQIMQEFAEWYVISENRTIGGENPSFDLGFLGESAKRAGIEFHSGHRTVDLHTICYMVHLAKGIPVPLANNRSDISLDYTLQFLGLAPEPKPHHALTGARLEYQCFRALLECLKNTAQVQ